MSVQRRVDTGPELALRRALHAFGLRYRVHTAPVPGLRRKADLVFRSARVAVFVDGCFWHGWPGKIARNRQRDEDTDRALGAAGWLVVRVWEHEIDAGQPALAGLATRLAEVVKSRRPG
jgi:DNA mismatch endonuclease (patch repair protein)